MTAQEEDSIEYIPDQRVPILLAVNHQQLTVDAEGMYDRADITVTKATPSQDDSSSPNDDANNTPVNDDASSASQGSTLPNTGDPLSTVMLALGGAASIAAYGISRLCDEWQDDESL